MKVTRIGDHVRIDMKEWSRWAYFNPGDRVTYYVGADVYDKAFPDGKFALATATMRMQMSNFVVVDGKLIKNRQLIEDLVEAYARQGASHG